MRQVDPVEAAAWCGGRWFPQMPKSGLCAVSTDSRQAGPGTLFFALKGEHSDGHDFLEQVAAAGGCAAVRADIPTESLPRVGCWLRVADPRKALGAFGAGVRRGTKARIVGVAGSIGKTSTKELVAAVLSRLGPTARTAGNFNNDIGLPLSLCGLEEGDAFGVFEAGISHPGEMAPLCEMMRPEMAVMTRIGPVHTEFFASVRAIAEEKAAMLEGLPRAGFAVLDMDDEYFPVLRDRCGGEVVRCSMRDRGAEYFGESVQGAPGVAAAGACLRVTERRGGRVEEAMVSVPPPGAYMAENTLKAVALGRRCGADWAEVQAALEGVREVGGMRWKVERLAGGATAVNDAYNANPVSMRAAMAAFAAWPVRGRRFLALGAMRELGAGSEEAHRALGTWVARAGDWAGVAVMESEGDEAAADALEAGLQQAWGAGVAGGRLTRGGPVAVSSWLRERMVAGDTVLLKASRGARLERILDGWKEV